MARTNKITSVSAAGLSKAVDKAIQRASKQFGVSLKQPNLSVNAAIIGRLCSDVNPAEAFALAQSVSSAVNVKGVTAEPAISQLGKDIFVGFVDREQLARSLG